ncbi:uncharacterized protein LOC111633519 [Centruroides sculpturatus]|uniref:uncharacterized protein LOC111633519 n=1 Tax=Centruroides sculpturatus TaxID=218467 RepID=UPI000C6E6FF8|nr:uncharacterized protein LOC111633519 [Centruroides sculpturatus]
MTTDIAKMYRQILVDPRDRCLQKILWRNSISEKLKSYKLTTVTYGTSPASFLATRCLKQLADGNEISYPLVAESIRSDFYVDDYLGGTATIEEAKMLQHQLIDLLATAGFPLRKWSSSHDKVTQNAELEMRENLSDCKIIDDQTFRALGVTWHPGMIVFNFNLL